MSTYEKSITYSRATHDYDCSVDGRYIGSRPNHTAGDALCDQVIFDMLMNGDCATATELDGGAVEMPGTEQAAFLLSELDKAYKNLTAHAPMLMPEGDWLDVEGMRVVAPAGMVVVQIATDHDVQCNICDNARVIRGLGNEIPCPYCSAHAPESLREDCLNVITMALGQTHGAASVVAELHRLKARLEAAAA